MRGELAGEFLKSSCENFKNSGKSPFVRYAMLDELHQPFVVDGVEIPPNVGVQHPAYLSRHDSRQQGVQRLVRTATRSETIRKTQEIPLGTSSRVPISSFPPALGPVLVLVKRLPLGQAPSLHLLRHPDSHRFLFGGFFGIYGPVRVPRFVRRCRAPLRSKNGPFFVHNPAGAGD